MNALCNYCHADLGEENPPIGACGDCLENIENFMGRHNISDEEWDCVPETVVQALLQDWRKLHES